MSEAMPTLDTFFQLHQEFSPDSEKLKALESSQSMARVKAEIGNAVKNESLTVSAGQLLGPIGSLLDINLLDIIVRAWNENNLFEKYLDPDKYDPKESILVSLKTHSISSSHTPHIDVTLNGNKLGQIDFKIDLVLVIEGVILDIRGGQVQEIRFGEMKGQGTLKCEDLLLLKRDTGTIEFPGKIKFSEMGTT